ncbi:hypothetical protein [Mycolicibacterium gilvum]|uniref:Alanine and proline rich membrane protein n=2 Tax=Mycolicibacterium gilvum TaxID=1804 RepID=E6TF15_MYCSR|nr:hypothetical protein [Mycolicibacterium gilvum]ADU01061.1 hypothetical protein Mspyr1_45060 [Mycolicibacterium gilvum Spyr1]MCV7058714.1 hypothetical protein [Mycolicibacterium gilvum]STZ41918.1 putative alanine and proline rich membrane protein [Mycolicibacterium gilvum]
MADPKEDERDSNAESRVSRVPQKVSRQTSPLTPIALVVSLIAVGIAVWALVSAPEPSSVSSEGVPLTGDPKDRICTAGHAVAMAVQLQTNANVGADPAAIEAVAANARLAMLGGGDYLLSQISEDAPKDVADTARSFGNTLQQLGLNALAGVANDNDLQAGRYREAEESRNKLAQLCVR